MDNPFVNLSKGQRYAVIGGSALVMGYYVYHHHSSTGSWNLFSKGTSTTTDNSTQIDPVTGMAYSQDNVTDPITGETYLQEADQYGSVQAAESSVSAFGQSTATGSGIPVNPASPASSGSINTPVGTSVYTSNAAWAQAVQAGLEDISGSTQYDGTDIGTALGLYLTQQPLTSAQAQVISVGIAEFGPAPVGNLQIILAPSTTTGTPPPTPTPTPGKTPAPSTPSANATHVTASTITMAWNKPENATSYKIRVTYQNNLVQQTTTSNTSITLTGLTRDHTYGIHVAAVGPGGTSPEGDVSVKTSLT